MAAHGDDGMTTINLTLYGEIASDLAHSLIAVASRINAGCEAVGDDDALPAPGVSSSIHVDSELVGTISVPGRLSFEDAANIASAERLGNIRTLNQATAALDALVDVLSDEDMEARHYTRTGLHVALRVVSEYLAERSEFLIEQQETLGFGNESVEGGGE